jgi:hypothetical protein
MTMTRARTPGTTTDRAATSSTTLAGGGRLRRTSLFGLFSHACWTGAAGIANT